MDDDRRPLDGEAVPQGPPAADGPPMEPPADGQAAAASPDAPEPAAPAEPWPTAPPPTAPPTEPWASAPPPPPAPPIVDWGEPPPEQTGPWQFTAPPGWSGLDVMSVFGRTIDTFLDHWRTLVVIMLPSAVLSLVYFALTPQVFTQRTGVPPTAFLGLLLLPVGFWTTTAIAMAADDARGGRRVSVGNVAGPAVWRSLVMLLSAIVVVLCVFGLVVVPIIAISIIAAVVGGGAVVGVLALIGFLAVFTAVIYVVFRWALGSMAIALDGAGPVSGLNRSWRITKGNLWRLGVLLIGIGILGLPWSIAGTLFTLGGYVLVGVIISLVGALLFGPLSSIVLSLAYGDITGRPRADVAAVSAAAPPAYPETGYAADTAFVAGTGAPPAVDATSQAWPAEPTAPVAGAGSWPPGDHAAAVPAAAVPAAAPSAAPALARAPRSARRAYVLGVLVLGVLLAIPAFVVALPQLGNLGTLGVASIPAEDRGKILAGTQRNPASPCKPEAVDTLFSTDATIYVGGYFNRAILPGQSARLHVLIDDDEIVATDLKATSQMVACYYEQDPLTGLLPGEYHLIVDDNAGVLAEGRFTIR
jgi:hypothetical protein